MKRSLLPLLVIGFTFVGTISGSAEEGMVTTLGDDGKTCGTWTVLRRSRTMIADYYQGWVGGFVSGANSTYTLKANINILGKPDLVDAEGLYAWVDNYCATNPLNTIAQASNALVNELVRRATTFGK